MKFFQNEILSFAFFCRTTCRLETCELYTFENVFITLITELIGNDQNYNVDGLRFEQDLSISTQYCCWKRIFK